MTLTKAEQRFLAARRFRARQRHGRLATIAPGGPEIIRIQRRRILAFNVDPGRPGRHTGDAGWDAVYRARWPR